PDEGIDGRPRNPRPAVKSPPSDKTCLLEESWGCCHGSSSRPADHWNDTRGSGYSGSSPNEPLAGIGDTGGRGNPGATGLRHVGSANAQPVEASRRPPTSSCADAESLITIASCQGRGAVQRSP